MGSLSGFQRFENVENGYRLSGLRIFDTDKYGGTKFLFFFLKNPIYWARPPNHSNTTTVSGNNKAVTNGDQSAALEVTKLSIGTSSLTDSAADSMRSSSVSSPSSVPAATVDQDSARFNIVPDNRDTTHLDDFPANWNTQSNIVLDNREQRHTP